MTLEERVAQLEAEQRVMMLFMGALPSFRDEMYSARVRNEMGFYELQDNWVRSYGECVPVHTAAKIVGKTAETIQHWAREGKIMKSETGGILTRSLAAHVEEGLPHNAKRKAKARASVYARQA